MPESLEVERFNPKLGWFRFLKDELEKEYFRELMDFVRKERLEKVIYPKPQATFRAFELTPIEEVKVVILGQDPYHGPDQATGLSFSVPDGLKIPPSLRNIFKELENDLAIPSPKNGNLDSWAQQGVFLLNSTLTVEQGRAGAHQGRGWSRFTDRVIEIIYEEIKYLVFKLLGKHAQEKISIIDQKRHSVLLAPHPSPLSAYKGFFGSHPFSQSNTLLKQTGKNPIHWQLP